jgi:hypothetical protein
MLGVPSNGENEKILNKLDGQNLVYFQMQPTYYAPSKSPFMMNFRVENLEKLLEILRGEGVTIVGEFKKGLKLSFKR